MIDYYLLVLTALLVYALAVYICKKLVSTVVVLEVYKDGVCIESMRLFANDFKSWIHGERLLERFCRRTFAQRYGLTWGQLYLLEHGFKISPDALIKLLLAFEEIEPSGEGYHLCNDSYLLDWCDELVDEIRCRETENLPRDSNLKPVFTNPSILPAPPCCFDEYIFKGKPLLLFRTGLELKAAEDSSETDTPETN